jgi:hypothetical protein
MQSNNRVSRIRPPPLKSKSKTLKTISEEAEDRQDAQDIMPPVPPSDLPPLKQSDSPEQDLALPYEPTKSLRMKDRKYESRLSTKKNFRNTKEWADEIKGVSTISSFAKLFVRQKKELNDKRKDENINEIDSDLRLKRKREFNGAIRACKETVNNLISLPSYFSSPDVHNFIFKLQNFIIELNNNILNINNEIQLNRPLIYDDVDPAAEELASSKSGGKRRRKKTLKKHIR